MGVVEVVNPGWLEVGIVFHVALVEDLGQGLGPWTLDLDLGLDPDLNFDKNLNLDVDLQFSPPQ